MSNEQLSDSVEQDLNQMNSATKDGFSAASSIPKYAKNRGSKNHGGRHGINYGDGNKYTQPNVNAGSGVASGTGSPVTENAQKGLNDFLFSSGKNAVRAKVATAMSSVLKAGASIILALVFLFILILIPVAITTITTVTTISSDASGNGGTAIVAVALEEEGTVGGDKYRKWFTGTADGAAWCATFVSWCANECGYIEEGIIPKFALCQNGMDWFKERNQYVEASTGYIPKAGDIIFYNWDAIPDPDHVAIVQYVENDTVVTIEGNTSNMVAQRSYGINRSCIMGYGTPAYPDDVDYVGLEGNTNAEMAWNFFIDHGYSEEATAGILGNLRQESGIDPEKYQYGGGPGRGICQWTVGSSRFKNLEKRAAAAGKTWKDLEIQLQFLHYELSGGEATCKSQLNKYYGGFENFKNATDIAWAVEAFEKSFERAGKPVMSKRIQYARQYYNMFAN